MKTIDNIINKAKRGVATLLLPAILASSVLTSCAQSPQGGGGGGGSAPAGSTPSTPTTPEDPTIPDPTKKITIEGILQDNQGDTNTRGEVQLYSVNGGNTNYIVSYITEDGNFNFEINETADELILKGRPDKISVSGADYYQRTVGGISGTVNTNVGNVRAVSYPDFCTPEELKAHMNEINIKQNILSDGKESGLIIPQYDRIVIYKNNFNSSKGSFTPEEIEFIKNKIKDSGDIEKLVEGRDLDSIIQVVQGAPSQDPNNYVEPNSIYVIPDKTIGGGNSKLKAKDGSYSRIIDRTIITFGGVNDSIVSHEFGHAYQAIKGEAYTLPDTLTIMSPYSILSKPGIPEEKAASIMKYPAGTKLEDIFGI